MKQARSEFKVCSRGHRYLKASSISVCNVCWPRQTKKKREGDLPAGLAAPARRALDAAGVISLAQLAALTGHDLSELHGMGPKALATLKAVMKTRGLTFAER